MFPRKIAGCFAIYQLCLGGRWVGKHVLIVLKPAKRLRSKANQSNATKNSEKKMARNTFPFFVLVFFFFST